MEIDGASIGFNLTSKNGDHNVGSVSIIDSVFRNTDVAMLVLNTNQTGNGTTGLTLDNVMFDNVKTWIRQQDKKSVIHDSAVPGGQKLVDTWTMGHMYADHTLDSRADLESQTPRVDSLLGDNPLKLPKRPFFERAKPQYENASPTDFIHVKDSCKGERGIPVASKWRAMASSTVEANQCGTF
jgi:hypothetical protein